MKTTIYIHNGDTKTGTSYIQNFLDVNRLMLFSKHRCLYPNFNAENLTSGRCHNHASWYKAIKDNQLEFNKDLAKLEQVVQKNKIDKVIFSNEAWFLQKEVIENFQLILENFEVFELKTISYLRRVDLWFESAWKQWGLKQFNSCEEFSEFFLIQERYKGILNHLDQWAEVIGPENVIVRPYEKQQLPNGLVHDFINVTGIDYDAYTWNDPEDKNLASNRGFNRDVLEMLHYCQDLFKDVHDNHLFDLFSELLTKEFRKKPFEEYALLSPQRRLDIINKNLPYEQQIAKNFMGRESGKVFLDQLPDLEQTWQPYEGMTLEKAIPIIITMIDSTNRIQMENRRQLNLINKKLNSINSQTLLQKLKSKFKKIKFANK